MLNTKKMLTKMARFFVPTLDSSAIVMSGSHTKNSGGFFRVGNIVLVAFELNAGQAMSANDYYTVISSGMPKPALTNGGVLSATVRQNTSKHIAQLHIRDDGSAVLQIGGTAIANGDVIAVSGVYVSV